MAFLALALVLALSGCGDKESPTSDGGAAHAVAAGKVRLTALSGSVTLERASVRSAAVVGPLLVQDALETGADSSASVRLADGRTVQMGANARFVVGENQEGVVLVLSRGVILYRGTEASAQGDVALSILTPYGITRVPGGASDVSIDVELGSAKVDVKLGAVELVTRGEAPRALKAGESASLGSASPSDAGTREITLEALVVTLSAKGAKVELKGKLQKGYQTVGNAPVALVAGDALRVKSGSSTLALGGSDTELSLGAGAEALFGGAAHAADAEETTLELRKGAASLHLGSDRKSRVKLGGTTLESEHGGLFGVQQGKDGLQVTSRVGDAEVAQGDVHQHLEAGERVKIQGGKATVERLASPVAELGARPNQVVNHPGLGEMTFSWPGGRAAYLVDVASNADFSNPLLSGLVHEASLPVPIPRKGQLFFRVRSEDGKTRVAEGSAHFSPEPVRQELERLRNEVPEGSETTTIYFQDKPPAVTFTYKADPKAKQYQVAVYRADELDKPVVERNFDGPRAALEAGLLLEGQYMWRVTPLSATGEALRGGKMSKLAMVYDNSVPNLVVLTPRNGERAGNKVAVSGVAPVGAKLFVNDKLMSLDDKHRFEGNVAPEGQPPRVVFRLTRPGGGDAITVRVLKSTR